MLDSSPVALPPIPRPLKRSASTASLPTPPRSYRRLARGKSRGSCDSDSDENVTTVGPAASPPSPPVTPKTRSSTKRALIRDSPDNPFLATPENHTPSHSDSSANPSPHEPLQERPTIAYVFRGVRRECKNPLYNHAQDRPYSPPPESKLPIDHPDYSPSIHCIPTRLFSDALSKRKKQKKSSTTTIAAAAKKQDPQLSRKRTMQRSPSLSDDDEDDDGVGQIRPLKLDFGSEKNKKMKRAGGGGGSSSLDQEENPQLSRKRTMQRSPSLSDDDEDNDGVGQIHPLKLDFGSEKNKKMKRAAGGGGSSSLDQEEF